MISDRRDWFQKELTVLSDLSTEWSVVPTPFVGLFNDQMEIFVKQEGDDIFLSDDGITLWNAESAGFDGDEPRNWAKLNLILAKYGATLNDEKHIVKQVAKNQFNQGRHELSMALLAINDMITKKCK